MIVRAPTDELDETSLPEAREEIRQKSIDALTEHRRVVYDVIEELGEVPPGALCQEYRDPVENPRSDRTVRNYLKKLVRYNPLTAGGSTEDRVYRCTKSHETS